MESISAHLCHLSKGTTIDATVRDYRHRLPTQQPRPGQLSRLQSTQSRSSLGAHDNTLDDYHVAIAHPLTRWVSGAGLAR